MRPATADGIAICVLGLLTISAQADPQRFALNDPTYRAECGSCHVPYPPQLLDAKAWEAIMAGLDQHYGSDASVDAKTAEAIRTYLTANASRKSAVPTSSLPRIS